MGVKPIALSFKNTSEDMDLYSWITSHSNMSGFIKDILRAAKESEENPKAVKTIKESKKSINLIDMDF